MLAAVSVTKNDYEFRISNYLLRIIKMCIYNIFGSLAMVTAYRCERSFDHCLRAKVSVEILQQSLQLWRGRRRNGGRTVTDSDVIASITRSRFTCDVAFSNWVNGTSTVLLIRQPFAHVVILQRHRRLSATGADSSSSSLLLFVVQ